MKWTHNVLTVSVYSVAPKLKLVDAFKSPPPVSSGQLLYFSALSQLILIQTRGHSPIPQWWPPRMPAIDVTLLTLAWRWGSP